MSEQALQRYQALPVGTMTELAQVGQLLAQTGMFGTSNPAEGFVIAALCHQSGITFIEYMQTYHLIKGKVSKRADAIQADFQSRGGKLKIVQRDDKGSVVELERDGAKFKSSVLWADCLAEPFVYEGKEADIVAALAGDAKAKAALKLKAKYATPRSRMQMLWARAISDGVRAVDPGSVQGSYTPEEIGDLDEGGRAAPEPVKIDPAEAAKRVSTVQAAAAPVPVQPLQPQARTVTPPKGEETPFDMIGRQEPEADYSACPVPGQMLGTKWDTMPTEHLKMALTLVNAELTLGHRKAIQEILNTRGGAQ